jgi:hypothetical protein
MNKPSIFASKQWCTVPFQFTTKTALDNLVDLLLQLPSCLPYRNEMRQQRDKDPDKSEVIREYLSTKAQGLQNRLHHYWEENRDRVDPEYTFRIDAFSLISQDPTDSESPIPCMVPFQTTSDAYITAMYDAGNIIVSGYLAATSQNPQSYYRQMTIHGASILMAAAYHETQGLVKGGSFPMVFPIKLLCLLSPSETQKRMAQETLLRWGSGRGLTEIYEVATPSYQDQSHG